MNIQPLSAGRIPAKGPVHQFTRLRTSQHLKDLRWIAGFVLVGLVGGLISAYAENHFFHVTALTITVGGIFAAAGAALNWAYQTGSNRLGMIDLFACEISVICRVCLLIDFAKRSVEMVKGPVSDSSDTANCSGAAKESATFASQEDYTPVYDQNLSQLQPLDAEVVRHVTEFYTYRKTMVDMLRRMATLCEKPQARREATVQMIYVQFLMYESARLAVEDLIEDEPDRSESIIGILCSELILYGFLLEEFGKETYQLPGQVEDFRLQRLRLRKPDYDKKVAEICAHTLAQQSFAWSKAQVTVSELRQRFETVFGPEALKSQLGEPLLSAA